MFQRNEQILFDLIFYLLIFNPYYDPSSPLWELVVNSIPAFPKFLHCLKGFNPRAYFCLFLAELILNDIPKGLSLFQSHRTEVLNCSSILHIVWRGCQFWVPLLPFFDPAQLRWFQTCTPSFLVAPISSPCDFQDH